MPFICHYSNSNQFCSLDFRWLLNVSNHLWHATKLFRHVASVVKLFKLCDLRFAISISGLCLLLHLSTIATIIASPFYGLLAEKAEGLIRGNSVALDNGDSLADIVKDVPRIIKRELQKMGFYLPRVLVCLIISFIPVVNIVAPICWFLLAAWMMSVQYVDYAYDNHKISFAQMRHDLSQQRLATFSMGAIISLAMTIPLLNLLIPPAAVCAGTKYYVEMEKRYTLDGALRQ